MSLKKNIKRLLHETGIAYVKPRRLAELTTTQANVEKLFDLVANSHGIGSKSKSQLKQDMFVLLATKFKRNGYFVEFGATNGIENSNTYLLETEFGWSGILAEPARVCHEDLRKNRKAHIDHDCVWSESRQQLLFNMAEEAALSTVKAFNDCDQHARKRRVGNTYTVNSITLDDLFKRYNAPRMIDYLSIDTEGSEYEILKDFPFENYSFEVITCEHNYTSARDEIFSHLTSRGYSRQLEGISRWDDWYVRAGP